MFLISKIDLVLWLASLIAVYSHIKALPSWISLRNKADFLEKLSLFPELIHWDHFLALLSFAPLFHAADSLYMSSEF